MKCPKVVIVILNWNGSEYTRGCLEAFQAVTYPNYEILLVDNGSTDNSVACLSSLYPDITIIENEENLGFAEGNNVGIRYALPEGADYVLLLNNDTVVEPEFLNALITVAERDPRIGIIGPKIVYCHDPSKIWSAGGRTNLFTGLFSNLAAHNSLAACQGVKIVDYVSGCALLIKTKVIEEVGLLDKDYFLYLEEADWNFRARARGYLSVVNCDATVLHITGASLRKAPDLIYYYFARNILLFLKKHGRWYHLVVFLPSFIVRWGAIFVWNLTQGNCGRCKYILHGIRDYLRGHYGPYP
jgi:GT2 family glycosyltransferase